MKQLITFLSICLLVACKSVPTVAEFKYDKGEIVYFKQDNIPMLIDKQIRKGGKNMYKVVFKNEEGYLLSNIVDETELIGELNFND